MAIVVLVPAAAVSGQHFEARRRGDSQVGLESVDHPGEQVDSPRNVAGCQVFEPLDAGVILEDSLLEERLPFPDGRQPLLGILQAGLGLAQVFFLLGHRRVVVGPSSEGSS